MINITETEKQISISDINEIEKEFNLKFPTQFVGHLLKFNGGKPKPNAYDFIENGKKTSSDLDWFLAVYDGQYDNIIKYLGIYKKDSKRIPTHFLPIGHDSGGNLVCISCGEKDYGYVYFWDHENEIDYDVFDDYEYKNIYLISKSFDEFLNSLH